jgi:predicted RNA methylase
MKFFATPYHYNLLHDQERLSAFYEALSEKKWGVVYDLGTGSGILSYFAAPHSHSVFALEKDYKSWQCARRNLKKWSNVQVINEDITDFDFHLKADLLICEMLDTALIDEEQIPVLNNALKYLKSTGKVIPEGVINGAEPVFMSTPRISYQDVDQINFPEYHILGDLVIFNHIIFKEKTSKKVDVEIEFRTKSSGKMNGIKITTFTLLNSKLICGPTPMLNPPLFIPTEEITLNKDEKVKVNLSYIMGGGLDNIRTKIKNIS